MSIENKIIELLKEIIQDLVKGHYDSIARQGFLGDFSMEELEYIMTEGYVGVPTLPHQDAYSKCSFYKYNDGSGYAIEFNLWFDGRESDLTLSCTVEVDFDSEQIKSFQIEEIHIL